MTRAFAQKGIVVLIGAIMSLNANAMVTAGTQLPLKAVDRQVFKSGEFKTVKFRVAEAEAGADPEALSTRLAGCTIEGRAAYNPRNARLYVRQPVLTCGPETKVGTGFVGGDIIGQLSESGLEGIRLDCPSAKECTIGSMKKDAEASFTVTETMGGGDY